MAENQRWQIHGHLATQADARLDIVRRTPQQILLAGADGDHSRRLLAARYPQAAFTEYDPRPDALAEAAALRDGGFWQRLRGKTVPQHGQSPETPLPEAAADMLWSNLNLPLADDLERTVQNWARALKPDGLLFFSHWGVDTLADVKGRLKNLGIVCHTPLWLDMHDLGDMLFHNGFYDPVMDTAKLELHYRRADTFWHDCATLGLTYGLRFEHTAAEEAARAALEKIFTEEGGLNITLETVFGHAVKRPSEKIPRAEKANESVIQFYPRT